jgi:hypothetical protein
MNKGRESSIITTQENYAKKNMSMGMFVGNVKGDRVLLLM